MYLYKNIKVNKYINCFKYYTIFTKNNNKYLHPFWVTGFADGESSFMVGIVKTNQRKVKWAVRPRFSIGLHIRDLALLKQIQAFFGIGVIYKHSKYSVQYRVESLNDLQVIIDHFDKYPLITQKFADFLLFKQIVEKMNEKKHLTLKGLEEIINIKASLNNGLSNVLKKAFPNVNIVKRPMVALKKTLNPYWVVGFVDGEGCFYVKVRKDSNYKTGYQVQLLFQITQHLRDKELINILIKHFGCGYTEIDKRGPVINLRVTKFADIKEKVISFFDKYSLKGSKLLDYYDFCKIVSLMKNNLHLTSKGIMEILTIKLRMNTKRNLKGN